MQDWEAYEADPRNHLRFVGSVRILTDPNLSSEAKLMACYMSLRDFDADEIERIDAFFNYSMTPTQFTLAALELLAHGYAYEPTERKLALVRNYADLGWKEQKNGR